MLIKHKDPIYPWQGKLLLYQFLICVIPVHPFICATQKTVRNRQNAGIKTSALEPYPRSQESELNGGFYPSL